MTTTKEIYLARRREWTHELRTTTVPQTKQYLWLMPPQENDRVHPDADFSIRPGMCCLGVAAAKVPGIEYRDSFMSGMGVRLVEFVEQGACDCCDEYECHTDGFWVEAVLPEAAMQYYGVLEPDPSVYVAEIGGWVCLSNLNDERDYSFSQIADVIDAQSDEWDGVRPFDAIPMFNDNGGLSHYIVPEESA